MINDKNLKQEGGESSTNLQGQTVNVYNGLTYNDAKEIALDVFNSNFIKLKSVAAEIASERAEEITEKIFKKLSEKSPESIEEFKNPAMQDALFQTQKEYAKSGDKDLGDLLIDIIIDRAETKERNMLQLVLDESLIIAPKLTSEHYDLLTLSFILTQTTNNYVNNLETFKHYIKTRIAAFSSKISNEKTMFNHLEYLGCGHIRAGGYGALEDSLKSRYQAFFSRGFTKEYYFSKVGEFEDSEAFIMPCIHDSSKFQIKSVNVDVLEKEVKRKGLPNNCETNLKQVFNRSTMSNQEMKEFLESIDSKMKDVFLLWENSYFKNFELSSVGISIANANFRRKTGETLDLSMWLY